MDNILVFSKDLNYENKQKGLIIIDIINKHPEQYSYTSRNNSIPIKYFPSDTYYHEGLTLIIPKLFSRDRIKSDFYKLFSYPLLNDELNEIVVFIKKLIKSTYSSLEHSIEILSDAYKQDIVVHLSDKTFKCFNVYKSEFSNDLILIDISYLGNTYNYVQSKTCIYSEIFKYTKSTNYYRKSYLFIVNKLNKSNNYNPYLQYLNSITLNYIPKDLLIDLDTNSINLLNNLIELDIITINKIVLKFDTFYKFNINIYNIVKLFKNFSLTDIELLKSINSKLLGVIK